MAENGIVNENLDELIKKLLTLGYLGYVIIVL